jgi:hypothetical protein
VGSDALLSDRNLPAFRRNLYCEGDGDFGLMGCVLCLQMCVVSTNVCCVYKCVLCLEKCVLSSDVRFVYRCALSTDVRCVYKCVLPTNVCCF